MSESFDGLEDKKPDPGPVWNKVPEDIAKQLVRFALAEPTCRHASWQCGLRREGGITFLNRRFTAS